MPKSGGGRRTSVQIPETAALRDEGRILGSLDDERIELVAHEELSYSGSNRRFSVAEQIPSHSQPRGNIVIVIRNDRAILGGDRTRQAQGGTGNLAPRGRNKPVTRASIRHSGVELVGIEESKLVVRSVGLHQQ